MVKCKIKDCLYNKDNLCSREEIEINLKFICANAKFKQSDNPFTSYSNAEEYYRKIKNIFIL